MVRWLYECFHMLGVRCSSFLLLWFASGAVVHVALCFVCNDCARMAARVCVYAAARAHVCVC